MSDIKLTNRVDQAVARLTAKKEGHVGKIVQVMGPVLDIRFADGEKRIDLRAALDCGAISPAGD